MLWLIKSEYCLSWKRNIHILGWCTLCFLFKWWFKDSILRLNIFWRCAPSRMWLTQWLWNLNSSSLSSLTWWVPIPYYNAVPMLFGWYAPVYSVIPLNDTWIDTVQMVLQMQIDVNRDINAYCETALEYADAAEVWLMW